MTLSLFSVAPYISSPLEAIGKAVSQMPEQWRQNAQFDAMQKMRAQQLAHQQMADALTAKYQPAILAARAQMAQETAAAQPEMLKSKMALEHAQAQEAQNQLNNIFSGAQGSGPAAQVEDIVRLGEKYGKDSEPYKLALQGYEGQLARGKAYAMWTMPTEFRAQQLAQFKSLGVSPTQAQQMMMNGVSVQDYAKSKGIPEDKIKAEYPAQTATITRGQQQVQASQGLNALNNFVANYGAQYGGLVSHYTHPWYWDAISGDPKKVKKAAQYYAAQAIAPEIANMRMRIQGGQPSAAAIHNIAPTVVGRVSSDMSYLPPKVQSMVGNIVTQELDNAVRMEAKTATADTPTDTLKERKQIPLEPIGEKMQSKPKMSSAMISVKSPSGQMGKIPASQLGAALKAGYTRV